MKVPRKKLYKRIDAAVRKNFWPVRVLADQRKTLAIGINQDNPRVGGRIWVSQDRSGLLIAVSVAYRADITWFTASETGEDWSTVVCQALCHLAVLMNAYDVEWATPDGGWLRRYGGQAACG